jgi:TPR repeat protein
MSTKSILIACRAIVIIATIATLLLSGFGYREYIIAKSWEQEVSLFKRGIKQGMPLAIYGLGESYRMGRGVPKDYRKARILYKHAANDGEILAQYHLGSMYQEGLGGKQNLKKATYYYEQAANQGYSPALNKLSEMYMRGTVVKQDTEKANLLKQQGANNFGKSLSYSNQYKQIIVYQLGEF